MSKKYLIKDNAGQVVYPVTKMSNIIGSENKQDKLTAGAGISISSDNTIKVVNGVYFEEVLEPHNVTFSTLTNWGRQADSGDVYITLDGRVISSSDYDIRVDTENDTFVYRDASNNIINYPFIREATKLAFKFSGNWTSVGGSLKVNNEERYPSTRPAELSFGINEDVTITICAYRLD